MNECYHNKFHGEQCKKPGQFQRLSVGNPTDEWTWCADHIVFAGESMPQKGLES